MTGVVKSDGERAIALVRRMNYERFAGTEGEQRGIAELQKELASFCAESRLESFSIPACKTSAERLTLPSGQVLPCAAYEFCGCTPKGGLTAPFLYIENIDEISLAMAKGCIVLMNTHATPDIYKKLVKAEVAGLISISGTPVDVPEETDLEIRALRRGRHYSSENPVLLPALTIRYTTAMELLEQWPDTVTVDIAQETFERQSQNIIIDIPGTEKQDEALLFCAHHDSVRYSHGCYDNASGSAIIMELCRRFISAPPKRLTRFIWFGAEEQGLLGSQHYAGANELENIRLVINIDLAGQIVGSHQAVITADHGLVEALDFMARETGTAIEIKQDIFSSDSSSFADRGVPAMSFYRGCWGAHSRYDTAQLMSARSLQGSIDFLCHFARRLADSRVFPVHREVPAELKKKLDGLFGRDTAK